MISLDSTFICHGREDGERHLEVRVGNVETVDGGRQVFGAVAKAETDITALIQRTLETVGRTDTTEVTAFTDGCPGLRTVLAVAGVTKPPILDWFHIAMRLQHTKLAAVNLSTNDADRVTAKATIVAEVERLHWRIWNGKAKNAQRSIQRIRKVMHVFKGELSQGTKGVLASHHNGTRCMRSTNISEAKPRGWSTMRNDSVLVSGSERRSPKALRTSWSTGALNKIAANAMVATERRSTAPGPMRQSITAHSVPGLGIVLTGLPMRVRPLLKRHDPPDLWTVPFC